MAPALGVFSPSEANPKAEAAAQKAVALDETLAGGHLALTDAEVSSYEWESAKREFQRALERNPGSSTAHYFYGWTYLYPQGRFDEGIAEFRRALELDPLSLIINANLADALRIAGRNEEALDQARKTVELDSQLPPGHAVLGYVQERIGKFPEAIIERRRARSFLPATLSPLHEQGMFTPFGGSGRRL